MRTNLFCVARILPISSSVGRWGRQSAYTPSGFGPSFLAPAPPGQPHRPSCARSGSSRSRRTCAARMALAYKQCLHRSASASSRRFSLSENLRRLAIATTSGVMTRRLRRDHLSSRPAGSFCDSLAGRTKNQPIYSKKAGLTLNETVSLERHDHLVYRGRADLKMTQQISFDRRPPEHVRIGIDEGQVLAPYFSVKLCALRLRAATDF
jgi:hypothetical protein